MDGMDLFAKALTQLYKTGKARLYVERDDHHNNLEDLGWYLTTFPQFPLFERQALKFARGRVLDAGCAAGRHSLYLQNCGLSVTAIDVSPQMVELARTRGVKDVRVADVCCRLPFRERAFDTVILFGNNLGLGGTVPRFRRMLRELYRVTSPRGRILATTRQPSTTDPAHRAYLQQNIARGHAPGQIRLRLIFNDRRGPWFDLLLLAPTDLMQLASQEGWKLADVFTTNLEQGYAVVMEKMKSGEGKTRRGKI
ncbi:MAG: class I SAM-dependent methyltransferase [Chloroflexota bacterium]